MKPLLLLFTLLFGMLTVRAQNNSTEQLTNAKVIGMVKGGLPKSIILTAIDTKQARFDTSTDALIALKKQGISDEIIEAMMNKASSAASGRGTVPVARTSAKRIPTLDLINQVYSYDRPTNKVMPLEKAIATIKVKTKMLGYGGASTVYIIDGKTSPVRMNANDSVSFVINTGGAGPDFTLFKLSQAKEGRQALTQKINSGFAGFGGSPIAGGATLSYNTVRLADGVYQIIPSQRLEKGEYFFAAKPTTSANSIDVYAFGIE